MKLVDLMDKQVRFAVLNYDGSKGMLLPNSYRGCVKGIDGSMVFISEIEGSAEKNQEGCWFNTAAFTFLFIHSL